jgi:SAM-dependent methyltransferase
MELSSPPESAGSGGESPVEIREAELSCRACGSTYPVEKGIACLLFEPTAGISREIKAWSDKIDARYEDAEIQRRQRELLLSLPFIPEELEPDANNRKAWAFEGRMFEKFVLGHDLRGATVLDIGAGRCWTSAAAAGRGAEVVALDILMKMYIGLETADIYIEERGAFFERVQGDMQNLPFSNGVFDLVMTSASAHHAADTQAFFREVARVLKDGGEFIAALEPVYWRGDEPPAEVEEGINEMMLGAREWLRTWRKDFLLDRCEVFEGRLISMSGRRRRAGDPARATSVSYMRAWAGLGAAYRWRLGDRSRATARALPGLGRRVARGLARRLPVRR